MYNELFRSIGLTEGETKVYLALLKLGSTKTGELCKISNVYTSKVYPILDKLIQKGLVSFTIMENIKYFQATDPNKLIDFVKNKKDQLEQTEQEVKKIIPELISKQKFNKMRQMATIYEGVDGIKTIFKILMEGFIPSDDYLVFSPDTEFTQEEELNDFFKKHNLDRIEKGIQVKMLAIKSQKDFFKKNYSDKNYKIKYSDYSLPAGINIVGSRVITLVWNPLPTAFVIESAQVAEKYKNFFYNLWESAEK